ncbi:flagellar basal-body rod protein FlgG [Clostridium cavendishii DSM 21758]|uniref:Flagellar basal-body rod protein FlgG n=1 Tax=Clostridium cavendishii DSM 21758 TaxID=1121302 RepID=A0A1M6ASK7_9CLOT|nr:flagellar hook-basal body complex protein [Clostridium cavendishii]SHI39417.1 flagellar basal-body rod protein FlgG [Clostridium cavendishii DSM 21758]
MIRGLYTAVSGMITLEAKQDVITNNMANANTNGYKGDDLSIKSFKDVLIENKDKLEGNKNVRNPIGYLSLGARIDETNTDYTQGVLQESEKDTDLAIEGKGFFVIQKGNQQLYTRDGQFRVNTQGFLVTATGDSVVGKNPQTGADEPIHVGNSKFKVTDGKVYIDGNATSKIKTVDFDDYKNLKKVGDNMYSGQNPNENAQVNIKQNMTEKSNVNIINEMVNMMTVMRSFETNQKIVQTIDETLGKAANEVGAVR